MHVVPFFGLNQKSTQKGKSVIHGLGGRPARPSQHFVVLEDSENGKVQKVRPKRIYKGRMPQAKIIIFIIYTDKRNVLSHFRDLHIVIWELGWPGFPAET